MTNRLIIGVLNWQPGWLLVLKQLGVGYERIGRLGTLDPESFSLIIVNRALGDDEFKAIDDYVQRGGAVLDTGPYLSTGRLHRLGRKYFRSIVPDDPEFADLPSIDVFATARTVDVTSYLNQTVLIEQHGNGVVGFIGLDVNRVMVNHRNVRRDFRTPSGRCADEITARVAKHGLRRVVDRVLRLLHAKRGIPYLRKWHLPNDSTGLFCYRIDSDYGTPEQVQDMYRTACEHNIAMTWFLHVGAHHDWLGTFRNFRNQEIAVHGYRHRTFHSYETNRANIEEATWLLKDAGFRPTGFAAPNGFWNYRLAQAVEDLGFDYASEFSLDFDNLPFFPWLGDRFSSVLQVPVHPISIGSLMRAGASEPEMKKYYRRRIALGVRYQEPVILYHHPGHGHVEVMADTFAYAREQGLPNMTLGEYARWWHLRDTVKFDAVCDAQGFSIRYETSALSVLLVADMPDGRRGFVAGDGQVAFRDLSWQSVQLMATRDNDTRQSRTIFSLRRLQHAVEDFNARIRQ